MIREANLDPIDVIGFSAGGFIAAEMAACDPQIFKHLTLVAPMGIKPTEGEITDIFPLTIRTYVRATVADITSPGFAKIYGGEMTPEQFETFEDARAELADDLKDLRGDTRTALESAESAFFEASKGRTLTRDALGEFHENIGLPEPTAPRKDRPEVTPYDLETSLVSGMISFQFARSGLRISISITR